MESRTRKFAVSALLAFAGAGAATAIGRAMNLNPNTMGFAYLIVVLASSLRGGLFGGTLASIVGTLCYNFFFLPPLHTFHIHDPSNWIALAVFLVTSVVISRLVLAARIQAEHAERRRNELETLYGLSVDLFTATNLAGALPDAIGHAVTLLGARDGGLVLFGGDPSQQNVVWWRGGTFTGLAEIIAGVRKHGELVELPSATGRDVYLPVSAGRETAGALIVRSTEASAHALVSASRLVGLALEREKFIEQRAHVHALQESEMLKTSLLRAISHDLTTPLTAITIHTAALQRKAENDAALRGAVEGIAGEAGRLWRRIDNLLSMARLEAGKATPRREPTPPADLLRAARENLPLVFQSRPVTVHVEDDCPDVNVDPSLALEILVNLIENAHRVSPPNAPLELLATPHPTDPAQVRIEILDRGPGLPESVVADLPQQGLGLEIARSLAAANGGSVALVRREGGGAIARLDVQAAPLPQYLGSSGSSGSSASRPPEEPRYPRNRGTGVASGVPVTIVPLILLVDDDPSIRDSMAAELRANGYTPVTASTAVDGLRVFQSHVPDLVLTDLSMPRSDGFELIAAIRATSSTPIIVLSVRGHDSDKIRALDLGADDFVTKPFSVPELRARIRAHLRRMGSAAATMLAFEDLSIDLDRRRVVQGGRDIRLTPTEYALLELLATNAGKPMFTDQIIARVWRDAPGTSVDTVRVHMSALRKKIEPDPSSPRYIVTEPWVGYRFIAEPL